MNTTTKNNAARDAGQITDEELISKHADKTKARARIEVAICRRLLRDLTTAGYAMIDEGDDDEPVKLAYDAENLKHLMNLDECRITCIKPEARTSFVLLIFGEDGYDLICDYGVSLEAIIEPIHSWIVESQDAGLCPVFTP